MRVRAFGFLIIGLLAGCSADWQPQGGASAKSTGSSIQALPWVGLAPRQRASFAALPDRGDLLSYDHSRQVQRNGAYTWHPIELSEAHAMRAVAGGELVVTAPNGQPIRLRYERHVEHDDGNWTWIGRVPGSQPGTEAILTFGEKAAFGSIPYGDEEPLRMTIAGGQAWLVETDRTRLALLDNTGTRPRKPDHLPAPVSLRPKPADEFFSEAQVLEAAGVSGAGVTADATTTVDVLLGYTGGFATRLGGQSQAVTRLTFLVDVANQAYINSQIPARLRLVRTRQIAYSDVTANEAALYELTGVDCTETSNGLECDYVGTPASLQPLIQERDQYGADLVSLVRNFNDPENDGCGIAWLNGAGQTPIGAGHADYGMSVVSDSSGNLYPDNGFICSNETLAHELGHNMGSNHDRETSKGDDGVLDPEDYGRYPYSFGHKTAAGLGNFYTIMAYGDSGQTKYRVFSNPRITTCGGLACGVTNQADNAQSLGLTMPIIAGFRPTVVPLPFGPSDLYAIAKQGATKTEVHILSGTSGLKAFSLHRATALGKTGAGSGWDFRVADFNKDGVPDLYAINKMGASSTEVHVLNGAGGLFGSFLIRTGTALGPSGTDNRWVFDLGDYNKDGKFDLYAINRQGASGKTEVHILNGANNFQSYLLHTATVLGATGTGTLWMFELGDYNGDGKLDLYAINRMGATGKTEVHVMNGSNNFQTFLLRRATTLAQTGSGGGWDFKLGYFNSDSLPDLYAINKNGATGKTEAHVLNGSGQFQTFLARTATALGPTGTDGSWDFDIPAR